MRNENETAPILFNLRLTVITLTKFSLKKSWSERFLWFCIVCCRYRELQSRDAPRRGFHPRKHLQFGARHRWVNWENLIARWRQWEKRKKGRKKETPPTMISSTNSEREHTRSSWQYRFLLLQPLFLHEVHLYHRFHLRISVGPRGTLTALTRHGLSEPKLFPLLLLHGRKYPVT